MKVYIGIDPDVEKSGVGIVEIGEEPTDISIVMKSLALPQLIEFLREYANNCDLHGIVPQIIVEAGWKYTSNWHLTKGDSRAVCAAKGKQQGRNQQLGMDICAMLEYYDLPHKEVVPLRKVWKGLDRKITHAELDDLVRRVNGEGIGKNRSNQEERDALLLAWTHSGAENYLTF